MFPVARRNLSDQSRAVPDCMLGVSSLSFAPRQNAELNSTGVVELEMMWMQRFEGGTGLSLGVLHLDLLPAASDEGGEAHASGSPTVGRSDIRGSRGPVRSPGDRQSGGEARDQPAPEPQR